MSSINFHTKEISVKLVYYGSGLCGKTSTLHAIYKSLPESKRPNLVSLATEVDRTIFFDFLPLMAYRIRDFKVRLQLYTVPGQVFYNATRKLVLQGVDGIIFVADSQRAMTDSNLESLQNLSDNLGDLGMEVTDVPIIIQANKRDLNDICSLEEMDEQLNPRNVPFYATVATSGEGVFEGLKTLTQLVINNLIRKGLGRQLSGNAAAKDAPPAAAKPDEDQPAEDSVGSTLSSVARAAAAAATADGVLPPVPRPAPPPASSLLWPKGKASVVGKDVEAALLEQRWGDVVIGIERLLHAVAEDWAASAGYGGDPVMAWLLTHGAGGVRYQRYAAALRDVRAGKPIEREEALNAVVLSLDSLW